LVQAIAGLDLQLGPIEMGCMWFDDLYAPGRRYETGRVAEAERRHLDAWRCQFTPDELAALAAFHSVFAAEVDALPCDRPDWHIDPGWLRVCCAAEEALRRLP
jgi:hypothetical protein